VARCTSPLQIPIAPTRPITHSDFIA
jgi:hypothetical protein